MERFGPPCHACTFEDLANRAGTDPFHSSPNILRRMPLVAHLRSHSGLPRGPSELACLVDRMREWFLAVNAFAGPDRRHSSHRMDVIRRSDQDCVDVFAGLFQHGSVVHINRAVVAPSIYTLTIVLCNDLLRGPAPAVVAIVEIAVVPELGDIADRTDVHVRMFQQLLEICDALSPSPDNGDIQLLARRSPARSSQNPSRDDADGRDRCSRPQETATIELSARVHSPRSTAQPRPEQAPCGDEIPSRVRSMKWCWNL